MIPIELSIAVDSINFQNNNLVEFHVIHNDLATLKTAIEAVDNAYLAVAYGVGKRYNQGAHPIVSVDLVAENIIVEINQSSSINNDEILDPSYSKIHIIEVSLADQWQKLDNLLLLVEIDYLKIADQSLGTFLFANQPFIDSDSGDVYMDGLLESPGVDDINISVDIPDSRYGSTSFLFRTSQTTGNLKLSNLDGRYDPYIYQYSIQNQSVRVYLGEPNCTAKSECVLINNYTAESFDIPTPNEIEVALTTKEQILEKPLQSNYVLTETDNELIPIVYGSVYNAEPPITTNRLGTDYQVVYHLGQGQVYELLSVKDRGVILTEGVNYDFDIEQNLLGIKAPPSGKITVDIGCSSSEYFLPTDFLAKPADIILDIIKNLSELTEDDLDLIAFENHRIYNPIQVIGIYVKEQTSVNQLIDKILSDCNSIRYWTHDNKLRILTMPSPADLPTFQTNWLINQLTITDDDILNVTISAIMPPGREIVVGYYPNLTPSDDLAGSIVGVERSKLSQKYFYTLSSRTSVVWGIYASSIEYITTDTCNLYYDFESNDAENHFNLAQVAIGDLVVIYEANQNKNLGEWVINDINTSSKVIQIIIPNSSAVENNESSDIKFKIKNADYDIPGFPLAIRTGLIETCLGRVAEAYSLIIGYRRAYNKMSFIFSVELASIPAFLELGMIITLKHHRFGLEDGKNCVIISKVESKIKNSLRLELWSFL